ncbi:stage III sporulation protein AF [Clostridium grantii DSM 8605]|uniref:Stage III sporulation protein AF n=2 Tax=Clostridium TaxID=1485 RepID=A0A1M5SG00_9CLOT|nr:stage III sporulation protein AF [Clostridium grantii DSM 8605]
MRICTTVFFITAVEMILPKNSIKKYGKFALGLILVTVIIDPFIKVFDNNFNLERYVAQASSYMTSSENKDFSDYKKESIEKSSRVFAENLSKIGQGELERIMPECSFQVDVEVEYNEESTEFIIQRTKVLVSSSGIKQIKKITIGNSQEVSNNNEVSGEVQVKVKDTLSQLLNISPDKIKIYKE